MIGQARIGKQPMYAVKACLEHEFRKRRAFFLEQHLNIARRDALPYRDFSYRKVIPPQVCSYLGFDLFWPRRERDRRPPSP